MARLSSQLLLSTLVFAGCKSSSTSEMRDFGGSTSSGPTSSSECDNGYIRIPKNVEVGVNEDFCVMKYEAKIKGVEDFDNVAFYDSSYRAESSASGTPWENINRNEAVEACGNVGAELISNAQWQAIARNIEGVAANWSGNRVGSGHLNRGHSEGFPTRNLDASDEGSGTHKRTHVLDNGEVGDGNIIWDLAGNVWEWVKDNNTSSQGKRDYVAGEPWSNESGKVKWGPKGNYKHLNSGEYGGLGYSSLNREAGAVLRGGHWDSGTNGGVFSGGVFSARLDLAPSNSGYRIGFRCVRALR